MHQDKMSKNRTNYNLYIVIAIKVQSNETRARTDVLRKRTDSLTEFYCDIEEKSYRVSRSDILAIREND